MKTSQILKFIEIWKVEIIPGKICVFWFNFICLRNYGIYNSLDTLKIEMSSVCIIFDILGAHNNRHCIEVFKTFDVNSVVLNMAASAETQSIECCFHIIKTEFRKKN